jgi:hypothetical protein
MAQQILNGHLPAARLGGEGLCRHAVGIDRDLQLGEFGYEARDRVGSQQLAFLGEHHRGERGKWLGH